MNVEQLCIESFCATSDRTFASTVTEYSEDAIALFCDDAAYLLYLRPGTADRYQFGICPCTKELLAEYTRQYPLQKPAKTTWIYDQKDVTRTKQVLHTQ